MKKLFVLDLRIGGENAKKQGQPEATAAEDEEVVEELNVQATWPSLIGQRMDGPTRVMV